MFGCIQMRRGEAAPKGHSDSSNWTVFSRGLVSVLLALMSIHSQTRRPPSANRSAYRGFAAIAAAVSAASTLRLVSCRADGLVSQPWRQVSGWSLASNAVISIRIGTIPPLIAPFNRKPGSAQAVQRACCTPVRRFVTREPT